MNEPLDAASLETAPAPLPPGEWRGRLNANFFYALFDQGIVSFGNMVVSASVARHCKTAEFGLFILALRSLDVLNQLCSVFIWGPYIFNMPAVEAGRRPKYLGSALLHQAFCCVAGVLLLLAAGLLARSRGDLTYASVFLPLALPSLAIVFREFTRRMYFAHFLFRNALITDSITVALQIAGILLLIHRGALSPATAIWTLSIGCMGVSVYWLVAGRGKISFSLRAAREDLTLNLKLGRWFFGSNMIFLGSYQFSPWLLSATSGPASVAAYAVCEAVVNIPRVALTSMQNTMGPIMSRAIAAGGRTALARVVSRMNLILIAGTLCFVVGIVTAGPWVARAIFHKTPADSRLILVFLALNLLVYGASLSWSFGLTALNKAQYTVYAGAAGLVAQLVVAMLLVRPLGVPGVALALLVGSTLVLAGTGIFYLGEIKNA